MLIRFSVRNFLSFNDEVEFSMIPGRSKQHPHHIVKSEKDKGINILKAGVIYGANASGKSNLIEAMQFARDFIIDGPKANKQISVVRFKLDQQCDNATSKFEFEFKCQSNFYAYGFELDSNKIHKEWLYQISKTNQKMIFERITDQNTKVEFGKVVFKDEQEKKLAELLKTRKNQLYLTQTIEAGVEQFAEIYSWFDKTLKFVFPYSRPLGLEVRLSKDDAFKEDLVNLLQSFDTGVSSICHEKISIKDLLDIPDEVKSTISEDLEIGEGALIASPDRQYTIIRDEQNELHTYKLLTEHNKKGSKDNVLFEVNEESDGTQRLMDLGPALLELLSKERIFVIDELDRSLHPMLSRKILQFFLNSKIEQQSQLIVTTHEASLLDLSLLRRDEIWFVEKNKDGASNVYSLEDFIPRYDKDIRKGYLLGRFGAIPVVQNLSDLGW